MQISKLSPAVEVSSVGDLDESVQCNLEHLDLKPADLAPPALFEKFEYNSFDSADSDDFSDYSDFNDNVESKQDLITNVVKKPT